jgi:glucan endo-1,3-alpha-glucosidase
MEQVIAMRDRVDMVEIISWNDYGESHYIGPIRVDQPNSQGWTNGMDHQGWLRIIRTYSTAFKTGKYGGNADTITLWSRPHPKGATATSPTNPRPSGWEKTDDNVYAFITVTQSSTIVLWSGNNTATWGYVRPGISKFSLGNAPGPIGCRISRGGRTIKQYDSGNAFTYTTYVVPFLVEVEIRAEQLRTPVDYNFNYFVGSA